VRGEKTIAPKCVAYASDKLYLMKPTNEQILFVHKAKSILGDSHMPLAYSKVEGANPEAGGDYNITLLLVDGSERLVLMTEKYI